MKFSLQTNKYSLGILKKYKLPSQARNLPFGSFSQDTSIAQPPIGATTCRDRAGYLRTSATVSLLTFPPRWTPDGSWFICGFLDCWLLLLTTFYDPFLPLCMWISPGFSFFAALTTVLILGGSQPPCGTATGVVPWFCKFPPCLER